MATIQFQGYIDGIDDDHGVIRGWAVDIRNPECPVLLHILMDGQEVMQVTCDLSRRDVRDKLHIPYETLGFQFTLPSAAFDGHPHDISIRFQDRTILTFPDKTDPYKSSDVMTFIQSSANEYESYLDGIQEGILRGWVVSRPNRHTSWAGNVIVALRVDGLSLGAIRANYYRSDVAQHLNIEANCGFEFVIPQEFADGRVHEFSVVAVPDNVPLKGSPLMTSIADDQLTNKLVQIENTIINLHQQLTALRREARSLIPKRPHNIQQYDLWARRYFPLLKERTALQQQAAPLKKTPLISVLCPTYRPEEQDFRAAITSVLEQTYQNWELIIIDDGGQCARTTVIIDEFCQRDARIRTITLETNKGIADATNAGIASAKGAYLAFLDHDDLLVNVALEHMVRAAITTGAKLLYSDEDQIDDAGHFLEPNFKPDFDYRYLLGCNYICHLTVIETKTARKIGLFDSRYNGAQDHDFLLRATEHLPAEAIHHVPAVLYHWRKAINSTARDISNKQYAVQAGIDCVTAHLKRRKIRATVKSIERLSLYEVQWHFRRKPTVSIIIPFRDQLSITQKCVESLLASQTYRKFDIILIDNFSVEVETLTWLDEIKKDKRVSIVRVEESFNYARLNNIAAQKSKGELLLFLNNDVFITKPTFLETMVNETLATADVGAVGARLLYPSGSIQHAGVAVGPDVIGVHVHRLQPGTDFGYVGRIRLTHEVTAVTGAALLVPHAVFDEVGGFDEVNLAVAFNDVDLCLKIRTTGRKVIYCAEAEAEHYESYSRGSDDRPGCESRFFHEQQLMLERWKENSLFKNDPAYPHYFRADLRTFCDLRDPETLWS